MGHAFLFIYLLYFFFKKLSQVASLRSDDGDDIFRIILLKLIKHIFEDHRFSGQPVFGVFYMSRRQKAPKDGPKRAPILKKMSYPKPGRWQDALTLPFIIVNYCNDVLSTCVHFRWTGLFPRVFHVLSSLYASRSTHSVMVDCNTANARTFLPMLGDACKCELRSRDRCHFRWQIDLYHESIRLSEGTKGKCPKRRLEEKTMLHELGYDNPTY